MEEDDEILYEFDVIYNKTQGDLKIMQFPLFPNNKNMLEKIKPSDLEKNNNIYKLEMTYENQQNQIKDEKSIIKYNGEALDCNTNYCIGIFDKNQLVLHSLKEFIQFRPTQDYALVESNLVKQGKKHSFLIPGNQNKTKKQENIKYKLYQDHSIESQLLFDNLKLIPNQNKLDDLNNMSNEDYYNLILKKISQLTVAENLYKSSTKTISMKELQSLSLNSKIHYFFKKSTVLNINEILLLCKLEDEPIDDFIKNFIKFIPYFAKFATSDILVYRSELLNSCLLFQKKRNTSIAYLSNGVSKINLAKVIQSDNEINAFLNELGEYFNGKWYLKGYIKSISNRCIKSELHSQIMKCAMNKQKEDREFYLEYKTIIYDNED